MIDRQACVDTCVDTCVDNKVTVPYPTYQQVMTRERFLNKNKQVKPIKFDYEEYLPWYRGTRN